mgnify:CR=1 FL=1
MGKYLWGIGTALIASLASLGIIIGTTTPADASLSIKISFIIAIMIAVWSLATLVIYGILRKRSANAITTASAWGFLVAFLAMMALLIHKIF